MKQTLQIITKKTQLFLILCMVSGMTTALQAQVNCVSMNCTADMTVHADVGSCDAAVNYTVPTAVDTCCSPPTSVPGYVFAGTFNGHTYFISTAQLIWSAASAAAVAAGGQLVSINSAAENAFVQGIASGQFVLIGGFQNHSNPGYSEPAGGWEWTDGSLFTNYTNWAIGEPGNGGTGEDFMEFYPDGTWNDLPDQFAEFSIAEFGCINNSITPVLLSGLASGSTFPVGTTTITYIATALNGSTDTCSFNVNVIDNGVTITANPPGAVCAGTGITFTATPFNGGAAPSYQWKVNGLNAGTDSAGFTITSLVNGDLVTCTMTSSASLCIAGPVTSNTIAAAISALPIAAITAGGPIKFCKGGSVILSANTGPGLTYQWSSVYVPIPGETNDSYAAVYRGWFRVTVTNAAGCTTISNLIHVYTDTFPPANITPSGPLTFCEGQSVTLTANSTPNVTYQWRKHNVNIAGATNSSFTPVVSGSYKVRVTNSNGCFKTSLVNAVSILPRPSAAVTASGPLTFCAGDSVVLEANSGTGLDYLWLKGGATIPGATLQNYTVKTAGTYKVAVTNVNGCSKTSARKVVTINCRAEDSDRMESAGQLSVFPNPATGLFTIKISSSRLQDGAAQIEITNVTGQTVYNGNGQCADGELIEEITPGSEWQKGVYFIKIGVNGAVYNGKVILQ